MSGEQTQTKESRPVVFIRKHADLEPILEELGPILTSDNVLQIDELALLFGGVTEPLTRTCEKGDSTYVKLQQGPNYVEREFHYIEKENHPVDVEDEFYWRETNPVEEEF